jgi:hypothetical protein
MKYAKEYMKMMSESRSIMSGDSTGYTKKNFSKETGITDKNYNRSWLKTVAENAISAFQTAVQGKIKTYLGKGQYQVPLNELPIEVKIKVFETWVAILQNIVDFLKQEKEAVDRRVSMEKASRKSSSKLTDE